MTDATIRILLAGSFGLVALLGGIIIELTGGETPPWLVAILGLAAGYAFGHVQANGLGNRKK